MTQLIRGRYTYLRYTQEQTGTLDRCVPISHGIPGSRRDGKTTSFRSLHSCSIHWLRFVIMQFLPSPYLSFSAIIRSYLGWETKPLETFQKLAARLFVLHFMKTIIRLYPSMAPCVTNLQQMSLWWPSA